MLNKLLHRSISLILLISIWSGPSLLNLYEKADSFLLHMAIIFFTATLSILAVYVFGKLVPVKCDQKECNGTAYLELDDKLGINKILMFDGHRCTECDTLVKTHPLPR